jgi:type I restriction enzyme, S subunit
MGVKEGYKQTEVGVIPEDWEVRELSSVTDVRDGTHESPKYQSSGVKFVTSKNIVNGKLDLFDITYISGDDAEHINKRSKVDIDDILMAMIGTIGDAVLIDKAPDFCIKNVALIKPYKDKVCPKYLYQLIVSSGYQNFIHSKLAGGIQKFISLSMLRSLYTVIPPLPEQKAIATALSDIDGLVDSLSKLIEKKKNIKQGAMQELLTGKKRLEGFSGEWVFRTLGNLFKFSGGYSASREQLSTEGYSYLHYGDIHGSVKTFVDIKDDYLEIPKLNIELNKISKDKLLQDGDVVFVDASEDDEGVSRHVVIRNAHDIPFISGLHTVVAKSRTNELNNLYKEYCFQSKEVKKQFAFYAVGIKVSGISRSNIIKMVLKIPPSIEEQATIATILSDMDSEIEKLQSKRDKYKAIKQGMMQELLTGRIRLLEGA